MTRDPTPTYAPPTTPAPSRARGGAILFSILAITVLFLLALAWLAR